VRPFLFFGRQDGARRAFEAERSIPAAHGLQNCTPGELHMRTLLRCTGTVALLALFTASEARAQQPDGSAQDSTVAPASAPAAGPTVASASVAVRATAPAVSQRDGIATALQQERNVGAGRNVALMVVGGAALITGLIIGDDAGALLAVGGAVVGLYGLYQFVR
jgi:hypothetical protein